MAAIVPNSINIVDPHVHLFNANEGNYYWWNSLPQEQQRIIARSFSVHDLSLAPNFLLQGLVHIEAGFDNAASWREIDFIEKSCDSLPVASIGYADITREPQQFKANIDTFLSRRSFRGIRHILDNQAVAILSHKNILSNLICLADKQLIFELQMAFEDAEGLALLISLLTHVPSLNVVINHCGSVRINAENSLWHKAMQQLARYENVVIKCSGWEMSNTGYTWEMLTPIVQTIVDLFGENRLMFASNFPLVLFSKSYMEYWQNMLQLANSLNVSLEKTFSENAINVYRIACVK